MKINLHLDRICVAIVLTTLIMIPSVVAIAFLLNDSTKSKGNSIAISSVVEESKKILVDDNVK